MVQEAVKQILKQKSHPYEVYIKSYKVIFSMLGRKVIFCIFSTYFNKETIETISKYQWNYSIGRSKLHLANWTYLSTLHMLAKT